MRLTNNYCINIVAFVVLLLEYNICNAQYDLMYAHDSIKTFQVPFERYLLFAGEQSSEKKKLPLSVIKFSDARIDTSCLCVINKPSLTPITGLLKYNAAKVSTLNGVSCDFSNYLNHYFSHQYTAAEKKELQVYLKHIMLSNNTNLNEKQFSETDMVVDVAIEMECFYGNGAVYFPALRIDTLFSVTVKMKNIRQFIAAAVNGIATILAGKLNHLEYGKLAGRRQYEKDSLSRRYFNRAAGMPMLQRSGSAKGIYCSFNEWVENKPSMPGGFTVCLSEAENLQLVGANGNPVDINKIFGVSDGKHFWIQDSWELYPLIRINNSYQFWGISFVQPLAIYSPRSNRSGLSDSASMAGLGMFSQELIGAKDKKASMVEKVKLNANSLHEVGLETGTIY